jgi:hypothetical protein
VSLPMFAIEDEIHVEQLGEFPTLPEAIAELRRLAGLPWNQPPNVAPCMSWQTCGRAYQLVEYDVSTMPWRNLRRIPALNISQSGVKWLIEPERL